MTIAKMLAVKFNAAETEHARSFNLHALRSYFLHHAQCALYHKQSSNDITVVAKNTVTPHIGTSLNYA